MREGLRGCSSFSPPVGRGGAEEAGAEQKQRGRFGDSGPVKLHDVSISLEDSASDASTGAAVIPLSSPPCHGSAKDCCDVLARSEVIGLTEGPVRVEDVR